MKLSGSMEMVQCSECLGRGKIPCPPSFSTRSTGASGLPYPQASTGYPIPCPVCKGTKIVGR